MTNKAIGERYGTSDEAVRQALARAGFRSGPDRVSHGRFLPWTMRADHANHIVAKRLRTYSRFRQGWPLEPEEARRLEDWIEFMEGNNSLGVPLAVHYDRHEGFWLEEAGPGDRDFIHEDVMAA